VTDPTPIGKHRRYTKRQKVTTVIAAEMSSVTAAAEASGIPATTIDYWMDQPEFVELRAKTREDMAEESAALAHKTLAAINAKLGEFEPRDLTILYGVLVDKSQLLTGQATGRTETRRLLDDFDDHETDAMRDWLRDVARQRLHADD
jgi:hypothetical protein